MVCTSNLDAVQYSLCSKKLTLRKVALTKMTKAPTAHNEHMPALLNSDDFGVVPNVAASMAHAASVIGLCWRHRVQRLVVRRSKAVVSCASHYSKPSHLASASVPHRALGSCGFCSPNSSNYRGASVRNKCRSKCLPSESPKEPAFHNERRKPSNLR